MSKKFIYSLTVFVAITAIGSSAFGQGAVEGSYLKDSLSDLKQSSKDFVKTNRNLKERVGRLEERIPILKSQLQNMGKDRKELHWQRNQAKTLYKSMSQENTQAQTRLFQLQDKLNKYYKEYGRSDQLFTQKESDIDRLRHKVSLLRRQVAELERDVSAIKPIDRRNMSPKVRGLHNDIDEAADEVVDIQKQFDRMHKESTVTLRELEEEQHLSQALRKEISTYEDDVALAQSDAETIESRWGDLREEHNEGYGVLTDNVKELAVRREKLKALIDQSVEMHDELTRDFKDDKNELYNTIKKLNLEREQLLKQEEQLQDSLQDARELLGRSQERGQAEEGLAETKKKLDELHVQQEELTHQIAVRQTDIKQARQTHESLEKDIKHLTREVERSRKVTDRLVDKRKDEIQGLIFQSRGRLKERNRDLKKMLKGKVSPKEILAELQEQKRAQHNEVAKLQQEIRDLKAAPVKIQETMEQRNRDLLKDIALLEGELKRMEAYQVEMTAMLEAVHTQLKDEVFSDKNFARSEGSLKEHLAILDRENTFLKGQVDTLTIAINKVMENP